MRTEFGDPSCRAVTITRRRLPHWEIDQGSYLVTIHLGDSLPASVNASQRERARLYRPRLADSRLESWLRLLDAYASNEHGSGFLGSSTAIEIVQASLQHGEGREYTLYGSVVMPNHLHFALRMLRGFSLRNMVGALKSATAHQLNRALNRRGTVWQKEYFDTLIDDQHQLDRVLRYISENPGQASFQSQVSINRPDFVSPFVQV